jgi:hypothetical protein
MKTPYFVLLTAAWFAGAATAALAADDYAEFNKPGEIDSKAAEDLITGSRVGLIVSELEKAGFEVEVNKGSKGQPIIASTDKEEPFQIRFYNCDDDGMDCGQIQFTNGWNLDSGTTAVRIEQWNADQVWGQAYRDEDKDPWVAMSVNLRGGVTHENFASSIDIWKNILSDFEDHIGWDN